MSSPLLCMAYALAITMDATGATPPTAYPQSSELSLTRFSQMTAGGDSNIFRVDLKTALFQGRSYGVSRDVVCQLPPAAGHPFCIAARLKISAFGMNDATRRW